ETHNVNWFEGNIGMLEDGTIIAPNDNQIVYGLNPGTGEDTQVYLGNEMVWSLPAVNPVSNQLFFGTTNFALTTVFSYDTITGKKAWTAGGLGSVAASPLLTSTKVDGAVIVGGFDGYIRAFTQKNGKQLWKVGTSDHIYSSPAQLSDGTIIQPAADGTVYAIDPVKGEILWKFDTLESIRSSPAVDGEDTIYVGSGEGKLFAINPDGTLRWAYQLISSDRNDLNSSPALGFDGIYIAGESGEIFFVPYDYPLTTTGLDDPNSIIGPDEALPSDGVFLIYTTPFGELLLSPPSSIYANQPLTFSLFVRENGDTLSSEIDTDSIAVSITGNPNYFVSVSADKQFITIIPQENWTSLTGGSIDVQITGNYKTNMNRVGLKFFGGRKAGLLDTTFEFSVISQESQTSPFQAPNTHSGNSTIIEFSRLAAPNPTILPSYNQIGFDSLHYLAGMVETHNDTSLLWVIGGKMDENGTVVDPNLRVRYPLQMKYQDGLITFYNYDGFKVNFIGSWDMPFAFYRISTALDPVTDEFIGTAALTAIANCDEIDFYGLGLKLMGISDFKTGQMTVFGGMNVDIWHSGAIEISAEIGTPTFSDSPDGVSLNLEGSTLKGDEHVYSLLLLDADGNALSLYYTQNTEINVDATGNLTGVGLRFNEEDNVSGKISVYFMVDTTIALQTTLTI
ncbi:MAG: PQQ-binding-like beta-propeller repeat protein, partial [Promethearchaeota archaeon]